MEHVRVPIIGGGVYGVSLAYHLGREGLADVMLVEKRNIRVLPKSVYDPKNIKVKG